MYAIYLKVGSLPTQLYLVVALLGFMALVSVVVYLRLRRRLSESLYSSLAKGVFFLSTSLALAVGIYLGVKLAHAFDLGDLFKKVSMALFFGILPAFSVVVMFLFLPLGRTEPKS